MTSVNRTPGWAVEIVVNVPRTCSGASGFGSNESWCVTPPAIHRTITDLAFADPVLAIPGRGRAAALTPAAATRRASRRLSRPDQAGGDMGIPAGQADERGNSAGT